MTRIPISDLPIITYSPSVEGEPFIAHIGRVGTMPVYFKGKSAFAAYAAAAKWRKEQIAKAEEEEDRRRRRSITKRGRGES